MFVNCPLLQPHHSWKLPLHLHTDPPFLSPPLHSPPTTPPDRVAEGKYLLSKARLKSFHINRLKRLKRRHHD